jgi:hypothetical protein
MHPWRMFIASSGKGLRYAQAIKAVIDGQFNRQVCSLWNQGCFEEERSFLDSLERLPRNFDCGLAVFTADDQLGDLMSPRDNVILEFGLFLGAFNRNRSFLLIENRTDLKLPSDYEGITRRQFYTVGAEASSEEHRNAVYTACTGVVDKLKTLDPPPRRATPLQRLELNWHTRQPGREFQLATLYGLSGQPEDPGVGLNYQSVYYLWADAGVGSWIHAHILNQELPETGERENVMKVEFDNRAGGFPGNVAIRLRKRSVPSAAPGRFQRIRFSARIPSNVDAVPACASVHMAARVVDALATHWGYCDVDHEYVLMPVDAAKGWQEFEIPLKDLNRWSVFKADGNYLYHDEQPDFSQILAVVVEVGSGGAGRPGPGSGVVLLKDFRVE